MQLSAKATTTVALLALGTAAWALSLRFSSATPVHPAAFVGLWTLMMVAMMAPSVLPTVLVFATTAPAPGQSASPARTGLFVTGYFLAWTALGAVVAAGQQLLWPAIAPGARWIAAAALGLAGVYQLTSWKKLCLTHCRTPLHFFLQHWRPGASGALLMGVHHGFYCVGCCAGLMAALITLGLMSPLWMVTIALVVLVEKVATWGERLALPVGVAMMATGAVVAMGWISIGMSLMPGM
ncbi:MAG: DUF2182 domain-containing protein [Gemmatimonadetes bacterium]|nr:DUF2182 domain-containing protein [Gemmatimonadota bacterium]